MHCGQPRKPSGNRGCRPRNDQPAFGIRAVFRHQCSPWCTPLIGKKLLGNADRKNIRDGSRSPTDTAPVPHGRFQFTARNLDRTTGLPFAAEIAQSAGSCCFKKSCFSSAKRMLGGRPREKKAERWQHGVASRNINRRCLRWALAETNLRINWNSVAAKLRVTRQMKQKWRVFLRHRLDDGLD